MEIALRKAQAKSQPHYARLLALHSQLRSTLCSHPGGLAFKKSSVHPFCFLPSPSPLPGEDPQGGARPHTQLQSFLFIWEMACIFLVSGRSAF